MTDYICCIVLASLVVNLILANNIETNFKMNEFKEQLKITKIARMVTNIKNLRQEQKTGCSIITADELKQPEHNVTGYNQQKNTITSLFQDCKEIYDAGYVRSGAYAIWINRLYKFTEVFCDMDVQALSNKTGWITIQKRINGEINFNRGWQNYVDGFGNVHEEHWVGLENIHALTYQNTTTEWFGTYVTSPRMRIDFVDQDGVTAYAEYEVFKVAGANKKYRLIAAYLDQATAIPPGVPTPISNHWFSTYDNNNAFPGCPETFQSGWWFLACGESNLNGPYPQIGDKNSPSNIYWYDWYTVNENNTAFKSVSMKFQY
uniref:Self-incompatibility-linked fibrinogen-like protein-A n=1 Tax=Ciona intestinalis TaxID=7719 RepID=B1Q456_CIOIN|nr:self-incompatibility-linked fibrinogen-like protein-A precursor [Ciona intestinalis]BAG15916.1 self-incompatibility-linked fibrinogen-like protein-A [Ciona intestinalis]BAG15918.1 self-incompatibility-linked fibrinogen-like protein-A [Ciona intestinalis]BAN92389.1 self-incompatibility-linked fibrinogen-like protein-A [Ciona intestinalis]